MIEDRKQLDHGKWMRLAAKRFIRDLKASQRKRPPFYFSPDRANHVCAFAELMPHVEGTWDSETIKLHPSHVFFLVNLFGFRAHDGTRRFTTAVFAVARKNAKSTLAAIIMLYCLCFENEQGAQVLSAATTGSQARLVFNVAKRMVDKLIELREDFTLETFANMIVRYEIAGQFKPINSKASTQDGLNPSHVSMDEIHAHKTRDLLDVLRSAAGARKSPLFLYTTTEGYENAGPWAELRAMAQNVLNGVIEAEHMLALIFAVDDEDSDYDERAWNKANPLMSVNPILRDQIRKMAVEARAMPGALSEFRIKRLNRRASNATSWTNLTKWRACSGPVPIDHMKGAKCWGAFDLASNTDMVSWRLLFELESLFYTWGRYWVPAEAVAHRTERKSVNYAGWIQAGFVTQCEGATIDYNVIGAQILEDINRFGPSIIAYDPWNASQLVNNLIDEGVPVATADSEEGLMQFIQGAKFYSPAMKACEDAYLNGRLRHGGDPVLTWNMANVVPFYDSNMNVKPNKLRSPDKIDGACSLFMGFGCSLLGKNQGDAEGFFASPVIGG